MNGRVLKEIFTGCVVLAWASGAGAATWSSGPLDLPIPDSDGTNLTHTIVVGENVALTDVTVVIAADHHWVGDLILWLRHPSGQVVTLMERPGIPPSTNLGDSADLSADYSIRFNDVFDTPANDAGDACLGDFEIIGLDCPGEFMPEESLLAAFAGLPTSGEWTLAVRDVTFSFQSGTLASWSLEITGMAIPLPGAFWCLGAALVALGAVRGFGEGSCTAR